MNFTLSDVAEIARAPKRAVQLWADAGVLKVLPSTMTAGSGVHRHFARSEIIVACIVAPFAKQKVAIGGLQVIANAVRTAIDLAKPKKGGINIVERAIANDGVHFLAVHWKEISSALSIESFRWLSDKPSWSFLEAMSSDESPSIKVDVVCVNEALRNLPR